MGFELSLLCLLSFSSRSCCLSPVPGRQLKEEVQNVSRRENAIERDVNMNQALLSCDELSIGSESKRPRLCVMCISCVGVKIARAVQMTDVLASTNRDVLGHVIGARDD